MSRFSPKTWRRDTVTAFLLFFAILAAHSILETVRDTLFLQKLAPSKLPFVYLIIAGVALVTARLNQWALERFRSQKLLSLTLGVAALVTVLFWFLLHSSDTVVLYAFYVWTGLVATLAVVQLWILLGDHFDATRAKREFAVIAAGGLVGATTGAGTAGITLNYVISPIHLVLIAAGIFMAASVLVLRFPVRETALESAPRRDAGASAGLRSGYFRRLLLVLTLTTITVTASDLLFKTVVAEHIAPEKLGQFFAFFYAGLNGLSLLIQLFFASVILRWLGVSRALWVLPVLLLVGALGFVFTAAVSLAVMLRVFDGSLRHSLNRTGVELLYLPLPGRVRARFKVLVDAVGARGGQAVASLGVLTATYCGATSSHLALGVAGLSAAWIFSVARIRRHYVAMFRDQLQSGTIETRMEVPDLDLASLEALVAALSSEREGMVINALELLEGSGRSKLIPALILYHPESRVVIRALEIFSDAERKDVMPTTSWLMASVNPEIRAAALQTMMVLGVDSNTLRDALEDPSSSVRATASVGLVARDDSPEGEVNKLIEHLHNEESVDMSIAVAKAIRANPSPRLRPVLISLSKSYSSQVRAHVAQAIATNPDECFLPTLLEMLRDRRARPDARAALLEIGQPSLDFLDNALGDDRTERRIRLHIPRTLSRFGTNAVGGILLRHLANEIDTNVGYKVLRGLGRWALDDASRSIDREQVQILVRVMLKRSVQLWHWRNVVQTESLSEGLDAAELLCALLEEEAKSAYERVFRLLGLLRRDENFAAIYQGLESANAKARASSLELLEHYAPSDMRPTMLAIAIGNTDPSHLTFYSPPPQPFDATMVDLLRDSTESIASLAANLIADLKLTELADDVEKRREGGSGFLVEVLMDTLSALKGRRGTVAT